MLKLKRKPLRTRWTEEYRKEHKKGERRQPVEKKKAKVAAAAEEQPSEGEDS